MCTLCLLHVACARYLRRCGFPAPPDGLRPERHGRERARAMSISNPSVRAFLDGPGFGPLRLALGRVKYLYYKLFLKRHHDGFVLENVCGAPLVVAPGVLNPRLMRTGEFLAAQLEAQLGVRGSEVLDMGTGSGVCAII